MALTQLHLVGDWGKLVELDTVMDGGVSPDVKTMIRKSLILTIDASIKIDNSQAAIINHSLQTRAYSGLRGDS